MRLILFVLALLSLSFSACTGQISQNVPAVMGQDGGLVHVTMTLIDAPGASYVSTSPRTGVATQESIESALAYASKISGKDCGVIVDFGANGATDYIDGPSAGTAFTVMAYALLENKSLRNDTVITGAIGPNGEVAPVGGLYEKATGAASRGARYFITPLENFYEMLLLRDIGAKYDIEIIQARQIEDVVGFMIANRSIEQDGLTMRNRDIPALAPYDIREDRFAPVAQKMIDLESDTAGSLPKNQNESAAVESFFSNEVKRQEALKSSGYLFSAANEAFLNYIDLSTIKAMMDGNADLPRKKGEAGICLSGIKRPDLTENNFEWVIGSDLRSQWAYNRLNATPADEKMLVDERFVRYNELMYAQAWCFVAKGLVDSAPSNGVLINESAWKSIADAKITQARALVTNNEDTQEKLGLAQDSYDKGLYGAAIFDAAYVIETEKSASEMPNPSEISAIINETRASLWGRIYQSHAVFLFSQNQSAAAYRTARFARGLDEAKDEMSARIAFVNPEEPKAPSSDAFAGQTTEYLAAILAIFLLIISMIILTRRNHGNVGKGSGKAFRAQQKKG